MVNMYRIRWQLRNYRRRQHIGLFYLTSTSANNICVVLVASVRISLMSIALRLSLVYISVTLVTFASSLSPSVMCCRCVSPFVSPSGFSWVGSVNVIIGMFADEARALLLLPGMFGSGGLRSGCWRFDCWLFSRWLPNCCGSIWSASDACCSGCGESGSCKSSVSPSLIFFVGSSIIAITSMVWNTNVLRS